MHGSDRRDLIGTAGRKDIPELSVRNCAILNIMEVFALAEPRLANHGDVAFPSPGSLRPKVACFSPGQSDRAPSKMSGRALKPGTIFRHLMAPQPGMHSTLGAGQFDGERWQILPT
jgi:hypothetical protein